MINEIEKAAQEIYSRLLEKFGQPTIYDAVLELSDNEMSNMFMDATIYKLGVDYWDLLYFVCHLVKFDRLPVITKVNQIAETKSCIGLFYVNESIIDKWLTNLTVVDYRLYYASIARHITDTHRSNYENFTIIYDEIIAIRSNLKKISNEKPKRIVKSWINHIYGLAGSNKSEFGLLDGTNLSKLVCETGRDFSNDILNKFRDNVVHIAVDEVIFRSFDSIKDEFIDFNNDLFTVSKVGKLEFDIDHNVSGLFLGKDKYVHVNMATHTTRLRGIKTDSPIERLK